MITTLEPTKYDSLFMTRSSFIPRGYLRSFACQQAMTYSCQSGIDLSLFATNRQICQEASEIFYSQNMFYVNDLSLAIPFLKDRGTRSKSLMRRLSINYPSPRARLEGPFAGLDDYLHDEWMLEDVCCYLSLHIQNLTQLDLRLHRESIHCDASLPDCADGKKLQSPLDFPAKQRKELATLGQDVTLTVSQNFWDKWRDDEEIRDPILFTPLRPWLGESIMQIRANHFSHQEQSIRKNAVEIFWQAHRKRSNEAYHASRTLDMNGWQDMPLEMPWF